MNVERYIQRLEALDDGERPLSPRTVRRFQRLIWQFFSAHGRSFAWRRSRDPYQILVSEIMLQQTQTVRVAERFDEFLQLFPTVQDLAKASQASVIRAWQGLGYYRRAKNLHLAAKAICLKHRGKVPRDPQALVALPGIGAYTAAAVAVFAFRTAVPMVETNIRAVYLFTFCRGRTHVGDREIATLVERTCDARRCREWFYALMDLGVELKRYRPGINHRSKHHVTQTPFKGSDREVAAQVLRVIISRTRAIQDDQLYREVSADSEQVKRAIERLLKDSLIQRSPSGGLRPV
jgi:A/G-specific adenine glycosylase